MPKFTEPEVEVKFTSNCFEAVILNYWSIEEAGKEATRLRSHISSTSTSLRLLKKTSFLHKQ